jgi:dihydrolipoamide dehydrogenase
MVMGELPQEAEVLILGGGPGGYAAAFRAADLGLDVTLVDMDKRPGGECLFRGCIPSKTLLYLSELLHDAGRADDMGIAFGKPKIDLKKLRQWKDAVVDKLADGLVRLCDKRGVQLIRARAVFEGSNQVRLEEERSHSIKFKHAILATGSKATSFPGLEFKDGGRVMDSAGALALADIPERLLVVGGGYVALEMGTVYAMLGSRVTVIVRSERLLRGADLDLVQPLQRRLEEIFEAMHFNSRASKLVEKDEHVEVTFEGEIEEKQQNFDRVLVAIGRRPASKDIGLDKTRVEVDEKGFVIVNEQRRTGDEHIFAIGDVVGGSLLAHKAMHEGKVAAEVIAGRPSAFDVRAIPAVVYTDPQVAWAGLTQEEAKQQKRKVKVGRFPWKFSGRAVSMGAPEGLTKIIVDADTERVLGVGVVGREAEGLIAEGVLAIEMGALAEDMALSIHAHPTLSETEGEASALFLGSATHILPQGKE